MISRRKWNTKLSGTFLKVISQLGDVILQNVILNFFLKVYIYFEKNNSQLTDYPQSFLRALMRAIFKSIFSENFFIWTKRQKFACPYRQI
jgi:hypothetical protein